MNADDTIMAEILNAADAQGILLKMAGPRTVELRQSLSAAINGRLITIPSGFRCDGCSIPRVFQRVFGHPLTKRYLRAALFHDWLCTARPWSQRTVSRVFYAMLRQDRNGVVRSRLMFLAVRFFGPKWNS